MLGVQPQPLPVASLLKTNKQATIYPAGCAGAPLRHPTRAASKSECRRYVPQIYSFVGVGCRQLLVLQEAWKQKKDTCTLSDVLPTASKRYPSFPRQTQANNERNRGGGGAGGKSTAVHTPPPATPALLLVGHVLAVVRPRRHGRSQRAPLPPVPPRGIARVRARRLWVRTMLQYARFPTGKGSLLNHGTAVK